ncbi:hypothetical protein [Paucibacter sp. XJ19-41]|uniref:hypothetical protein n=1 Tax=Paucibacter sp. XJ19-41 TaxID=2927824 RepID=UPI00234B9632|nr:hypothetical protein [Paucibacter sp. XJ19-41]MDC6170040.1 hypothetical protein [Paucibacter sp. XJ19-41]
MWISKYWYEKLPALYAAAALLSLAWLGTPAAFSATLLMAAAALTAWWRYQHRRSD